MKKYINYLRRFLFKIKNIVKLVDSMKTTIKVLKKIKPNNPILIEGLPGIGYVGRIAAQYLIEKLGAEKIAELYSPYFFPFVVLHGPVGNVLKNEFYYWKNPKGRDLIILIGDSQCSDASPKGYYDIAEKILDFCEELGVKEIFTLGGFGSGEIEDMKDIEVLGAVTHEELVEKYEKYGIDFRSSSQRVGMIVGATGLLLGLGKERGMKGVCLMGETTGYPIITDPRAAEKILKPLIKILDIDVDLSELDKKAKEVQNFLSKLEKLQEKALEKMMKKEKAGKKN
ncbi:MAG: proteasome assembly chaperone family protein [Candidatus Aenigmarchaeota archaeon]|nr:proteasome assembly chaperone family protein [Candidatus Aenigmarchaeota archaeon]